MEATDVPSSTGLTGRAFIRRRTAAAAEDGSDEDCHPFVWEDSVPFVQSTVPFYAKFALLLRDSFIFAVSTEMRIQIWLM